jgi:hypothetical protein
MCYIKLNKFKKKYVIKRKCIKSCNKIQINFTRTIKILKERRRHFIWLYLFLHTFFLFSRKAQLAGYGWTDKMNNTGTPAPRFVSHRIFGLVKKSINDIFVLYAENKQKGHPASSYKQNNSP